ncbi:MAG: DUF2997 domain-containing protein [Planctomycetia bacterium]
MSERKIEITVSPEGSVSIKAHGFQGGACRDATRDLERALGIAGTEHLLPEYFQQGNTGEQLRQGT